jgi:hypothetical protein
MKTININVTKIDKSALYEGKNGKYLSLVLFDNKDGRDQYGNDGFVTQDLGKERRMASEKGPILGNWKEMDAAQKPAPEPAPKQEAVKLNDDEDDQILF